MPRRGRGCSSRNVRGVVEAWEAKSILCGLAKGAAVWGLAKRAEVEGCVLGCVLAVALLRLAS